jgi:hypothetical protein
MMKAIRTRLTYANVMSTIAVFLLLGGASAFAASKLAKNSVGAKQIKKNSVGESKLKKDAVTGEKVKDGSLTGADINLATLGAVPSATKATSASRADTAGDASTLQGKAANAFIQGSGQMTSGRRNLAVGETNVPIITLPGLGSVTAECKAGPEAKVFINNSSGSVADYVAFSGAALAPNANTVANGGNISLIDNISEYWHVQLATQAATPVVSTVDASFRFPGGAVCTVFAQATTGS